MDRTGYKDASKRHEMEGGTGPVGTEVGPVVPGVLLARSIEWILGARNWLGLVFC